jgi:ketosteroid isomerase-like protein
VRSGGQPVSAWLPHRNSPSVADLGRYHYESARCLSNETINPALISFKFWICAQFGACAFNVEKYTLTEGKAVPMRKPAASRAFLSSILVCMASLMAIASGSAQKGDDHSADRRAIEAAISSQAEAWNRADIPAFMQIYEDSPDTTFIGAKLRKGYGPILERYKSAYTTPDEMGKLTFRDLDIRLLPSSSGRVEYAVVTGTFHLERRARGEAKKDDGIFSLVWRKGPQGWKIILDHTS